MKRDKFFLTFITVMILGIAMVFSACAESTETGADNNDGTITASNEKTSLRIGASPEAIPLVESGVATLEAMGYQVEVVTFDDFFVPNVSLDEGSIDANFYQHQPFLDTYNEENGTNIEMLIPLYNYSNNIYSYQADSLDNLPEGGNFGIANDASNIDKYMRLLAKAGLITLIDEEKEQYTVADIVDNPKNLNFVQLDYKQRIAALDELAGMICGSTNVFVAGLDPTKGVLYKEIDNSYALGPCINANTASMDDQWVKDLYAAYTSDEAYQYVLDYYQGAYEKSEEFQALTD